MDATDRRRYRAERRVDPNEFLIMLEASAQRLKWSQQEAAIRSGMARWRLQSRHCPFEAETQRMLESAT